MKYKAFIRGKKINSIEREVRRTCKKITRNHWKVRKKELQFRKEGYDIEGTY